MSYESGVFMKDLRTFSDQLKKEIRYEDKKQAEREKLYETEADKIEKVVHRHVALFHKYRAEAMREVLGLFADEFSDYDDYTREGR